MAWTTPRTWVVGDVVTASMMNTNVRDNLLALSQPQRKTTSKTVNTTTTATDLLNGEITIAGGVMGTSGVVRVDAWGDWKNNSGGTVAPPRIQVVFGGTTLFDTGASGGAGDAVTRYHWEVRLLILNTGAVNAQTAVFDFKGGFNCVNYIQNAFTTGEGSYVQGLSVVGAEMFLAHGVSPSTAVDTSTSKALVLNVINGSASGTYETKLLGSLVEVLPS